MSAFELGEGEEEEEKRQGGLPDPPSDYPCEEEGELEGVESSAPLPPFPPIPVSSGPPIKAKEVVLISLALLLLACSVLLFFKHWKKNYRDINQLPYYAYLYQKEDADFAAAPPPPPDSVAVGGPASAAEAASAPQQPPPPALPPPPQSSQQVVSSMVRAQSGNRFLRVHTNKGSLQNVYLVASREGGGCSSEADGGVERANCSSSNSRSAAADPGAAAAAAAALLANRRALLNRAASSPRLLNRCSSVKLHPHSVRLGSVVAAASASSANARFKQQAQPRLTMPPMMAPAPLAALPSVPKASSSNSGGSSSFTPPVRRSPVHHHHPSPGQRPPPPLRRHLAPKRAASDVYIRFNKCRNELMRRIQSGHQLSEEDDEGSKNPSQGESLASLTGIQRAPPSQAAAECFEEEKEEEEEEEVVEVAEQHPSRYTTSSSMGQPSSANRSPALSSPLQILDGEEERGLRCRPAEEEEEEEEVKGGQEDCRRIGDLHSSLGSSSSSSSSSFQVNNSPCQEDEREVHPAETKPSSWWLSRGIEENGEAEGGGGGNREEGEDKKVAKGAAGGDNEVERGREEEEENEEVEGDEDEETAGEDHDPPSSWVQKSSSVTTDV